MTEVTDIQFLYILLYEAFFPNEWNLFFAGCLA